MFWFILFIVLVLVLFAVYRKKSDDIKEGRGEETVQDLGQHAVEELPEA